MSDRPAWEREGRDWPNRGCSRFLRAGGLRWHVQVMGSGPVLLLLHGTAAATHSWRDLMPALAGSFTVVAPDLPGHGFTELPAVQRLSLPGMAAAVHALLQTLELSPAFAVGHSAGAAILLRLALDERIAPSAIVSLNGALLPLGDRHAAFFTRAARMLASLPFVPGLLAWRASNRAVAARLLADTGSRLDARGVDLYGRLFQHRSHIAAALGMMANWDLVPLLRDLPRLRPRLVLVTAGGDRTIPPAQAERVRARHPAAHLVNLPGLGHLAHEEQPQVVASLIRAQLAPEAAGDFGAPGSTAFPCTRSA